MNNTTTTTTTDTTSTDTHVPAWSSTTHDRAIHDWLQQSYHVFMQHNPDLRDNLTTRERFAAGYVAHVRELVSRVDLHVPDTTTEQSQ